MWYPTRAQWRMIWVTAVVNFALFVIGNRDPVVALLVLAASIFLVWQT
jgi:hypothetical protein